MAGYVRQSVADIVNGENITAPPINAEFNQIQVAFTGDAGHTHDGTIGEGPKINLTTSVDGYLPAAHGGVSGANNPVSVIDPTELDDADDGYAVGSIWINNNTDRLFVCMDNTVGSAIWHELAAVTPSDKWLPKTNGTVDLGSTDYAFRDIYLTGTFTSSFIDGTLGANNPAPVTATNIVCNTITADNGDGVNSIFGNLYGTANGSLKGNLYSDNNTLILNNGTDGQDAQFTGSVVGDVTGNITATEGSSTLNDVTANDITANTVTATFTGNLSGNVSGDVTGNVTGNVIGDVTGNLNGNTAGSHTGPVDAANSRITNVADPESPNDALSLRYFNQALSQSEDGIQADLDAAIVARDTTLTYMNITFGYRNETEDFRDETFAARDQANLARDIAVTKAASVSNLYDSTQYAQRLIGSLI